jgi:hypothetical protein
MLKVLLNIISLLIVIGGVFSGYIVQHLPMWASIIFCSFGFVLAACAGMTMWALTSKKFTESLIDKAMKEAEDKFKEIIEQQKIGYHNLLISFTAAIANRVASRVVVEMVYGLNNSEQQDAARLQAQSIVAEELGLLMSSLEKADKECQEEPEKSSDV